MKGAIDPLHAFLERFGAALRCEGGACGIGRLGGFRTVAQAVAHEDVGDAGAPPDGPAVPARGLSRRGNREATEDRAPGLREELGRDRRFDEGPRVDRCDDDRALSGDGEEFEHVGLPLDRPEADAGAVARREAVFHALCRIGHSGTAVEGRDGDGAEIAVRPRCNQDLTLACVPQKVRRRLRRNKCGTRRVGFRQADVVRHEEGTPPRFSHLAALANLDDD